MRRPAWLACAAVLCLSAVSLSHPERQESAAKQRFLPDATTWKYFPQPIGPGLVPYIADLLNFTDEPSLLASAQDPATVSYRFDTLLMPQASFRVIRFSLNSDGTATVAKFLLPRAINPSAAGRPNKIDVNVSAEDASKFLASVDGAGFWTMPTVEPPNP